VNGDGDALFEALAEIITLEQASDGVFRAEVNHIFEGEPREPFAVEPNLRLLWIENLEDLLFVSGSVAIDLITRHRGARNIAAGRIADDSCHVPDHEDDRMAEVLEVLHLSEKDNMAEMKVWRSRIKSRFDTQRTIIFYGRSEAVAELFFADELSQAFLDVGQLLFDGRKWHDRLLF
jgi:hypothetical protein